MIIPSSIYNSNLQLRKTFYTTNNNHNNQSNNSTFVQLWHTDTEQKVLEIPTIVARANQVQIGRKVLTQKYEIL